MNSGILQPSFLWALAGLAIPVVVHLVYKRKSRRIDLGTLRFLKSVLQANSHTRNLKRWLLLAMRLGCVALLVGVFARPYWGGVRTPAEKRFVAILIDQSASMERRGSSGRLIDQAVAKARSLLRDVGDAAEVRVAFFDHTVHPLELGKANSQSTAASVTQIQGPASLTGATNFSGAMEWARDVCVRSKQPKRQIVVFTDLQRSGLDWAQTDPLPPGIEVRVEDLGQSQTTNAAVSAIRVPAKVTRPGNVTTIVGTIFNAGPFDLKNVDVVLHASRGENQFTLKQQVSVAAGSTVPASFETPELSEGLWRGYLELEHDDDMKFDNRRWFAIPVARPLNTLIVDGQPNPLSQRSATYFLHAALRLAPPGEVAAERLFEPTLLPIAEGTRWPDLKGSSIVVLANLPSISSSDVSRLAKWVRAGGGLLVFAGDPTTREGLQPLRDAGLGVGEIRGFVTANNAPWRLEDWNAEHPIFELFGDVQRGDLSRRGFRGITRIEPDGDVAVLARFTGGAPAVLERSVARGRVIWVAAGCDGTWSDWPRSRLFLPLTYQLLGYLGGLAEGGPVRNVTIDGETKEPMSPGIVEDGNHWNVVNVSPRESETDRCSVEEFANRFGVATETESSSGTTASQSLTAGFDVRQDEIWPYFLLTMLALFLAEGFLANRTIS